MPVRPPVKTAPALVTDQYGVCDERSSAVTPPAWSATNIAVRPLDTSAAGVEPPGNPASVSAGKGLAPVAPSRMFTLGTLDAAPTRVPGASPGRFNICPPRL